MMKKIIALLLIAVMSLSLVACGGKDNTSKENPDIEVSEDEEISVETKEENIEETQEENTVETDNELEQYVIGEWKSESGNIIFKDDKTCEFEGTVYEWELVGKVFLEYELSVNGEVQYIFMENTSGDAFNLFTAKKHERTGEITTDHIVSTFTKEEDVEQ